MLPFVLPERANVPPEDGRSSLDILRGQALTIPSAKMGGRDSVHHRCWDRLYHP